MSSATVDRDVSVAVADDEEAYLHYDPGTVADGTWRPVVGNNVVDSTFEVTVSAAGAVARMTVETGDRVRLTIDGVACGDEATITAVGDDVRVDLSREVPCPDAAERSERDDADGGDDGKTEGDDADGGDGRDSADE